MQKKRKSHEDSFLSMNMFLSFTVGLTAFAMRIVVAGIVEPGIVEPRIMEAHIAHHECHLSLHSSECGAFRASPWTEAYLFADLLLATLREFRFSSFCTCA